MNRRMRVLFASRHFRGKSDCRQVRGDEQIMLVDLDRCIGCGLCGLGCVLENEKGEGRIRVRHDDGRANVEDSITLPTACRCCQEKCDYYSYSNFWTVCPHSMRDNACGDACNECRERTDRGYWPACATRCSMKAIYYGTTADLMNAVREKGIRDYNYLLI